jgi:hypothetical protein
MVVSVSRMFFICPTALHNVAKIYMPIFHISPIFSWEEYYAPKKYQGIFKSHNVPHFNVFANFS